MWKGMITINVLDLTTLAVVDLTRPFTQINKSERRE